MSVRRKAAMMAAIVLSASMALAGCGGGSGSKNASDKDDGSMMTVDVYDDLANYQGIQKGWFAKIVKDKFNMKLNIIAPNVAGGGQTLFDTRTAAGDLGDIVITGASGGQLKKLIKSKLLVNMAPYAKNAKRIKQYQSASESLNTLAGQKTGDIWGVPGSVSAMSPTSPSEGLEPTFGPYLRWDLYKAVGYPEINDLDDLVGVLQQMQDKARADTGDNTIYAMSLFKDWDGNMMNNAKQPACYYGYDEMGFVLAKADGSDYQSVTKKGGRYEDSLRFFNKANRAGLVDPESSTQNYDTMYSKYQQGKVLFSFWPWLGQAAYNTTDHKAKGKGFMIAPLKNMKIFSYGAEPDGDKTFIGVGVKAQNKQRLVNFIDWLYSPEGVYDSGAQTGGSAGPKGLNWTVKDGQPVLTEFGEKVLFGEGASVPSKWGTGTYKDGVSALNYPTVIVQDKDPQTGYTYNAAMWPSELKKNTDALSEDWSAHMGGAKTTMEYLQNTHRIMVAPGASYLTPDEDSQIKTIRGQVKTEIINESWKAVMANSDVEFNTALDTMRKNADGIGMKQVLKVDMNNAKDQNAARVKIEKQYQKKK